MLGFCYQSFMQLWLASASPRRKAMLEPLFFNFRAEGLLGVDETPPHGTVEYQVSEICQRKVGAIPEEHGFDLVLVCDTMIADPDDHLLSLGKPNDELEAAMMLHRLSGRRHLVWTASSMWYQGRWLHSCESSVVEIPSLSVEDFTDLLSSGSWQGKAGGYDLHGKMGEHASVIDGNTSVVLGITREVMNLLETLVASQL